MRSRYRVHNTDQAHFVTSTVVGWLPIFTTAARCDLLVESLDYCRTQKELKIYAWVILDNHFHAILSAPDLPRVMADLKRHTARRLLEVLQEENADWLLHQLRYQRAAHKAESEYQVWQEGFHPQSIPTDAIMLQKLEYLHNNPVKRGLVSSPEHWRYSSAHEWLAGAMPLLRCDDWRVSEAQLPAQVRSQVQLGNEENEEKRGTRKLRGADWDRWPLGGDGAKWKAHGQSLEEFARDEAETYAGVEVVPANLNGAALDPGAAGGGGAICRSAADAADVARTGRPDVLEWTEPAAALSLDRPGADAGDVPKASLDFRGSAVLPARRLRLEGGGHRDEES